MEEDCKNGRKGFCMIGNVGSRNRGSVDGMEDVVRLGWEYGIWVDGDGGFGGGGILGKGEVFRGIEKLDCVCFDGDKWFFECYDIGCMLVKDGWLLKNCLFGLGEYVEDGERRKEEIKFCDYGMEVSRRFGGLKLWLCVKIYGLGTLEEGMEKRLYVREEREKMVEKSKYLEVIRRGLGVCVFGFVGWRYECEEGVNEVNENIVKD
ncbi:PLP-dependent decarboxylase, partial [Bacillus thuringiensis]|uniref:PLP-dependent decarboxylase n=1 Tax=Bacillus thuringiensis TaxID=1428 RepID=UPI0021B4153F